MSSTARGVTDQDAQILSYAVQRGKAIGSP
jgi:hypothetical protein